MARGLYDCEPVFRAALDQCAELLQPLLPQPLLAVLFAPAASPALIDATEYTQPALFAVEYSLAQLWMSWGVKPSIVMGHSVGEFVAACVAGVFSLQDALRLIAERGRLMGALPRNGAMLAVNADEAAVGAWLAPFRQDVSIAAVNGPAATVLSGLATAIDTIAAQLDNKGIGYTRLKVSHAFHSPLMAPMLAGFERVAQSVSYALPQLDLYSNVTGELSDAAIATATYWRDHISAPVRFADALAAIAAAGCDVFVEVGPHPTLIGMGQACLPADQQQWLPSLRRGRPDGLQIQESLARLHVQGVSIDWRGFHLGRERPQVDLPRYPFQRTRYWAEFAKTGTVTQVESLHPLLGREVLQSLSAERLFEAHIEISRLPYLRDHRILGALLLPSPAHMEMALAAAAQQFGASALEVRDFTVHRALSLEGEQAVAVQLAMSPQNEGVCDFRIASFDAGEREWRVHATGALAVAGAAGPVADLKDIEARVTQPQSVPAYYEWLTTLGLQFGDTFRGVESIARRDGEVLARMQLPAALVAGRLAYRLHPALLDACLHVVGAALPGSGSTLGDAFLLLNVERIRWHRPVGERFWNHVIIEPDAAVDLANRETLRASLRLLDDDGQILVAFEGMHFKRARPESLLTTSLPVRVRRMLHEVVWREVEVRGIEPLTPAQISGRLLDSVFALAQRNGLDAYADFLPRLDALASAYVVAALRELGFDFVVGGHLDANVLASQLHVLPTHSRLFGRMLDMLREDGVLHREGTGLRVAKQPEQRLPEDLYNEILAQHPDCEAELTLTRRCAGQLAPVLKGEADPLALLFPGGSLADTERLYRNSPPAKTYNGVIAEIVRALAATWTSGRPLRVLEIGAGTGSTTGYVLPLLAAQGAEYTFTDVSPLFLNRARDKFGTDGAVRYALLDISRAPVEQGFTRAGYDLIIGANVIHATPDLDVTLTHVRELLAPGATLLLLEGTSPQRFGDLTVGLLDGWWAYTDLTRRDYALMSRAAWLELFAAQGLRGSLALPGDTTHPVLAQQAVFIAQRAPAQTNAALPVVADRWVLLCADDELGSTLAAELRRRGAQVELLSDAVALQETLSDPRPIRGVVSLAPVAIGLDDDLSTARIEADQRRLVESLLHTVHALATVTRREVPPLWIVTRGAQSAAQPESANAAQATAWGMSHVIALEHPELRCRRVDLDGAATTVAAAGSLADELLAVSGEDQLALRAGRRLARRLVHHDAGRAPAGALHIDPHRSYLITGGLRGLGLRVAEWLVGQGARHLVLMGRKSPDATASAVMARLRGRGVQVTPVQGDVSSASDVAGMLDVFGTTLPALAGVVHAAGALDDGVIASQDWSRFATVMAPKVMGTWNLHTLCGELDFLVLFSSGASVAGSPGQVNHAAANAFEDALSWYRQSQGRPTLSINWGPWAEIGAAADRQLDQPGSLRAIAPADGLMALQYAMRRADARALFATAQLAVLDTDWEHLAELRVIQTEPPLFAELAIVASRQVVAAATSSPTRVEPSLAERIAASAFNRRKAVLRDHVRALTVEVLGLQQAEEFDINEPLRQLGLDSLMAVELRNLLGKAVGRTLPATVTFDQPSVAALTDYLAREVFAELLVDASAPEENVQAATPAPAADSFAELSDNELALQLLRRLDDLSTLENP